MDTCGTGGDGSNTFNISTAAAIVVAAAGVPVAKHGNRAMTSACGSADVLEALGVATDLSPDEAAEALRTDGFAFLFAQGYHPAMKHAGPTRREIGVRTAFNLIGPMTNPAGARRQVVGVGDPAAAPKMAEVLRLLGSERALVVHGAGVDELPLDGSGVMYDVTPAGVTKRSVVAADLCLTPAPLSALAGGRPAENAALVEAVLAGKPGPHRDVVLLNAAAAFVAADLGLTPAPVEALVGGTPEENATLVQAVLAGWPGPRRDVVQLNAAAAFVAAGLAPDLRTGFAMAALTIESGAVMELLERLRAAKTARDAARMEASPA